MLITFYSLVINSDAALQQNKTSFEDKLDLSLTFYTEKYFRVLSLEQEFKFTEICVVTVLLAVNNSNYTVTVQSLCLVGDWWNRSFAVYVVIFSR